MCRCVCVYIHIYIYIYIYLLHLSLSLYIYIYVYIHSCVATAKRSCPQDPCLPLLTSLGKAPKGNRTRATDSKTPPAYQNPCFSLLSMLLRTLVMF